MSEKQPNKTAAERVAKFHATHDRINISGLPLGTCDRIRAHGFTCNSFARELVLSKLDELDRMKPIKKNN